MLRLVDCSALLYTRAQPRHSLMRCCRRLVGGQSCACLYMSLLFLVYRCVVESHPYCVCHQWTRLMIPRPRLLYSICECSSYACTCVFPVWLLCMLSVVDCGCAEVCPCPSTVQSVLISALWWMHCVNAALWTVALWLSGRALDLRFTGRGFNSRPVGFHAT